MTKRTKETKEVVRTVEEWQCDMCLCWSMPGSTSFKVDDDVWVGHGSLDYFGDCGVASCSEIGDELQLCCECAQWLCEAIRTRKVLRPPSEPKVQPEGLHGPLSP